MQVPHVISLRQHMLATIHALVRGEGSIFAILLGFLELFFLLLQFYFAGLSVQQSSITVEMLLFDALKETAF